MYTMYINEMLLTEGLGKIKATRHSMAFHTNCWDSCYKHKRFQCSYFPRFGWKNWHIPNNVLNYIDDVRENKAHP